MDKYCRERRQQPLSPLIKGLKTLTCCNRETLNIIGICSESRKGNDFYL